jgi:hypothetical protein
MVNLCLNRAIFILGLLFMINPLYWDLLVGVGVAPALDWLAAVGLVQGGTYYLAIGGMYALAGVLVLRYDHDRTGGFRQLGLGVGVSLLVVWTGLLVYWWTVGVAPGFGSVAFAFGTGPVLIGLLLGATADHSTTRNLWGVAILLLFPFVGWIVTRLVFEGRVATPSGFFLLLSGVLLAVLDVIWGYPLYRPGRSLG